MQTAPTNWNTYFSDPGHSIDYRIEISNSDGSNSTPYGIDVIRGAKIDSSLLTADKWIGRAITRQLTFTIAANIAVPRMAKIVLSARLALGGAYTDFVPIGTFWVDRRGKGRVWRTITCYDGMLKTEQPFVNAELEAGTWPIAMTDAVAEICTRAGITLDARTTILTGADYAVSYPNDLSMREVLENIAAAHGGNWTITPGGKLRLVPLQGYVDPPNHSFGKSIKDFKDLGDMLTISKVTLQDDAGNEFSAGDDTGYSLTAKCLYATQNIANAVNSSLHSVTYKPFESSGSSINPLAELGDSVSVNSISSIIFSMSVAISKSFSASLSCPADEEIDHEYPYLTAIDRQSNRTVKLGASYYGTTISRANGLLNEKFVGGVAKAKAVFNADEISMKVLQDSSWVNQLYAGTDPDTGKPVFFFDGKLTASVIQALSAVISPNLYAEKATISELTVDQLDTSDKVQKYLAEDDSDDNFQRVYDQWHEYITAVTDGLEVNKIQATNRNGEPLYWTDETRTAADTTEREGLEVWTYAYTELAKLKIGFREEPSSGQYMPMIELGAGIGDGNKGKGFIYKGVSGLYLDYYNNNGELRRIILGTDGIVITPYELKQLDFYSNGFSAKYSAETVSLTWEKDSSGRITALTTEDNVIIPVHWNAGDM